MRSRYRPSESRGTRESRVSTKRSSPPARRAMARLPRGRWKITLPTASRGCALCSPPSGGVAPGEAEVHMQSRVKADATSVFPRFLDLAYPVVERGEGVWL